jgi:23S rRNA pseudouridine1911/1915/1917 synthase
MVKLPPLHVLYEDNHLPVINKPAGLATQGVSEGTPSVATAARRYLKQKHNKPGNVYLGVVSRLDAATSGVLVLARTSKAAARLSEQFRAPGVEKTYWALVERAPVPPDGTLTHWLVKDDRRMRMVVARPHAAGAQKASLSYAVVGKRGKLILVEVQLHTGRKHQIRVQLAERGCPVAGDRKYGSRIAFAPGGIALHARRLTLDHPTTKERLTFDAPPPATWPVTSAD